MGSLKRKLLSFISTLCESVKKNKLHRRGVLTDIKWLSRTSLLLRLSVCKLNFADFSNLFYLHIGGVS